MKRSCWLLPLGARFSPFCISTPVSATSRCLRVSVLTLMENSSGPELLVALGDRAGRLACSHQGLLFLSQTPPFFVGGGKGTT